MKTLGTLFTLCAVLWLPVARAAQTNAPTVIIYRFVGGPARAGEIGFPVIAALWSDGRIVWSESRIEGGPPYRQGRFAREKLDSLLDTLERKQVFRDATQFRGNFGPDAGYTTIAIDDGRRRVRIQSWHETFEQNTNLVATAGGVATLRGATREDVLRKQPEAYRRLRTPGPKSGRRSRRSFPRAVKLTRAKSPYRANH